VGFYFKNDIAAYTEAVNRIETEEIANFTSALTSAFTLLEKYRWVFILKITSRLHGGRQQD
jgi:hypothetical protein